MVNDMHDDPDERHRLVDPFGPISQEVRAQAKSHPGERYWYRDVEWEPGDDSKVRGYDAIDDNGNFSGERWINPDYIPSSATLGEFAFRMHADLDMEMWRFTCGYLTLGLFLARLAESTLYRIPNQDNAWSIHQDEQGNRTLDVYSAPAHMPIGSKAEPVAGLVLLEDLAHTEPDLVLSLNPTTPEIALRIQLLPVARVYARAKERIAQERAAFSGE